MQVIYCFTVKWKLGFFCKNFGHVDFISNIALRITFHLGQKVANHMLCIIYTIKNIILFYFLLSIIRPAFALRNFIRSLQRWKKKRVAKIALNALFILPYKITTNIIQISEQTPHAHAPLPRWMYNLRANCKNNLDKTCASSDG